MLHPTPPLHATQPLIVVNAEIPDFVPLAESVSVTGSSEPDRSEEFTPMAMFVSAVPDHHPSIEMRRLLSIEGLTANQFMRLLGLTSAAFSVGVAAWWMVGPQVSANVVFAVIAIAIGLALANLVALFVLVALADSRPDSHSYMAELVAAQKVATAAGRPGPVDLHPTGDPESRWGFG